MPPLPPIDYVSRVAVQGEVGTGNWANIFHFLWDAQPSDGNMDYLATQVYNAYAAQFLPYVPSEWRLSSVVTVDLGSSPALPGSATGSSAGSSGDPIISAQVCTLVKHIISRRYRGGHPRTYLPGGGASQLADADKWNSTQVDHMQTAWDNFISAVVGATYTGNTLTGFVNVSYFSGGVLRTTPVVDSVTGSVVEAAVATQRRRLNR
jgi:hypothetical protein